jgi:hypothetical protein
MCSDADWLVQIMLLLTANITNNAFDGIHSYTSVLEDKFMKLNIIPIDGVI